MKNLEEFNLRGWIPGPHEEKDPFLKRVEALDHFYSNPPTDVDHFLTTRDWTQAIEKLKGLYDMAPDWIVAHYSDRNLTFFQGAATWITEKGDYRIPLVQLKEKFERGSLLKVYGKSEVLAHEAVHAARMQFDEPRFEEIFAYKTSPYFWRRLFGPLFEKPWEATLFITLVFVPLIFEILRLFWKDEPLFAWAPLLPFAYFAFLLCRLLFLRTTLCLALRRLKGLLKNPTKKWAAAMRMRDRELFLFAYRSKESIESFLKKEKSLRWQLLKETYFKKR